MPRTIEGLFLSVPGPGSLCKLGVLREIRCNKSKASEDPLAQLSSSSVCLSSIVTYNVTLQVREVQRASRHSVQFCMLETLWLLPAFFTKTTLNCCVSDSLAGRLNTEAFWLGSCTLGRYAAPSQVVGSVLMKATALLHAIRAVIDLENCHINRSTGAL